jgi:hypothetical protein
MTAQTTPSTFTDRKTVYGDGSANKNDNPARPEELERHAYYIYLVTNEVTGTVYIGQHRSVPGEPWRHYLGSGTYLRDEARGYGVWNFSKKLLAYAEDGLEAKLLEGRFISKALLKPGYCFNSNNSESVARDPANNLKNFAFKASFRGRQRIEHNISIIEKLLAYSRDADEVVELAKLKVSWLHALRIKDKRFSDTKRIDPKDWAEDKYGFNPNDERD